MTSDEDEKFLYGSDEEAEVSKSVTEKRPAPASDAVEKTVQVKKAKVEDLSSSEEDSSEEDESDEESDVEFIIGVGNDSAKLDSKDKVSTAPTTNATTTTISASAPVIDETTGVGINRTDLDNKIESTSQQVVPTAIPGTERYHAIDLDAPGKLGDQAVTDIDPEVLKEKPWRQPGANLSDYFNYGFNEQTWMEYLHRQEKLRNEYNPQKLLMGLLALQQQGKLNGTAGDGNAMMDKTSNSMAPAGFTMGMSPMFGGFPFPFPGMMNNMSQQKK
ncbi:LAMI_0H03488g1_1 [Lachancea mirantina]|uniref:Pre-mRNA polyadenylation factor FIP1 n=1 Tax=Lachancea mirantina TaxID=1230905 RepID=A0A1G4KEF6_9SACH|nr:LAMI_0H03488g1_1 [Lachancea mirantina]